jgi:hypothetical protein
MPITAEPHLSTRLDIRRWTVVRLFTTLFNQAVSYPLIVVALTVLVQVHFGWRAILLFPILLMAAVAVVSVAFIPDVNASVNELIDFRMQFPNVTLTPVPVSDYLAGLRDKVPRLRSSRADQILPLSSKLQNDRIRILLRSSAGPSSWPLPPSLVTYANLTGAWVILSDPPERLTNLGYFLLLHELGHTAFTSFAVRVGLSAEVRIVLLSGAFLSLLISPTGMQAIGLLVTAACWYALVKREQRRTRTIVRVFDEISADTFALKYCDPSWFMRYSVSDIISVLSRMDAASETRPWTQEEIDMRTHSFSEDLHRLANGQPLLHTGELAPGYNRLIEPGTAALVILMVLFGLAHAPLSYGRLALLGGVSFLGLCAALFAVAALSFQKDLVDHIMGIKPMDPAKLVVMEKAAQRKKKLQYVVDWMKQNPTYSVPNQDARENIRA